VDIGVARAELTGGFASSAIHRVHVTPPSAERAMTTAELTVSAGGRCVTHTAAHVPTPSVARRGS
jgi:hypothetical protein